MERGRKIWPSNGGLGRGISQKQMQKEMDHGISRQDIKTVLRICFMCPKRGNQIRNVMRKEMEATEVRVPAHKWKL
jgi:hypothetical protein